MCSSNSGKYWTVSYSYGILFTRSYANPSNIYLHGLLPSREKYFLYWLAAYLPVRKLNFRGGCQPNLNQTIQRWRPRLGGWICRGRSWNRMCTTYIQPEDSSGIKLKLILLNTYFRLTLSHRQVCNTNILFYAIVCQLQLKRMKKYYFCKVNFNKIIKRHTVHRNHVNHLADIDNVQIGADVSLRA